MLTIMAGVTLSFKMRGEDRVGLVYVGTTLSTAISATDLAEQSPAPEPLDALEGMYAEPPRESPLWFREGTGAAVPHNERVEGWGTADV